MMKKLNKYYWAIVLLYNALAFSAEPKIASTNTASETKKVTEHFPKKNDDTQLFVSTNATMNTTQLNVVNASGKPAQNIQINFVHIEPATNIKPKETTAAIAAVAKKGPEEIIALKPKNAFLTQADCITHTANGDLIILSHHPFTQKQQIKVFSADGEQEKAHIETSTKFPKAFTKTAYISQSKKTNRPPLIAFSEGKKVKLWNFQKGLTTSLEGHSYRKTKPLCSVTALKYLPEIDKLVSGAMRERNKDEKNDNERAEIRIWDLEEQKPMGVFKFDPGSQSTTILSDHLELIPAADGKPALLAGGNSCGVLVWDIYSQKLVGRIEADWGPKELAYMKRYKLLVVNTGNDVQCFDPYTQKKVTQFNDHYCPILKYIPHLEILASTYKDRQIILVDPVTKKIFKGTSDNKKLAPIFGLVYDANTNCIVALSKGSYYDVSGTIDRYEIDPEFEKARIEEIQQETKKQEEAAQKNAAHMIAKKETEDKMSQSSVTKDATGNAAVLSSAGNIAAIAIAKK